MNESEYKWSVYVLSGSLYLAFSQNKLVLESFDKMGKLN